MGLAASQARLLLLTARKSDLEYRAQQITNAEMILAMQTEQVAREYSIKISNQALFFTNSQDANQTTICLSGKSFANKQISGYDLYELLDGTPDPNDNKAVYVKNGQKISAEAFWALTPAEQDGYKCYHLVDYSQPENLPNGLTLLESIKNGSLCIIQDNDQVLDLNSNNGFTQSYYTDDDRAAEAEYERKTAEIQVKEKRLQNDLNQVETQQKACDTEIDSVKKVMEKNIERTFKVFS